MVAWLRGDHSSGESIKKGAELLLRVNRNRGLYERICRNPKAGVKKLEYLTNANEDTSETENITETKTKNEYEDNSDTSTKSNILTIEDYAEHVHGKRSYTSYAELLLILRQTFLNVDQMIIDECSDLFFGLWM